MRRVIPFLIVGLVVIVFVSLYFFRPSAPPVEEETARPAETIAEAGPIWNQARELEIGDDLVAAREAYWKITKLYPDTDEALRSFNKIEELNLKILFSPTVTDDSFLYEVKAGDTLGAIAKAHHTTVELIKRSNNLTSDLIKPGQKLKVSTARYSITVDKSQYTLTLKSNGGPFKTYRVSVGPDTLTPNGEFTIINRLPDPVWYVAGAIVPPDSPKNILGSRWLGLSETGYGIHGTIDPESIGQPVTQGCVRMTNSDVEELFIIVPVDTKVTIKD